MQRKFVVYMLMLVLYSSSFAWGGVYQCVDEKGAVEFRDTPCNLQSETFLPIQYSKASPKQIKKEEKERIKTAKKQAVLQRKEERMMIRTEKQRLVLEEKAKRRQERCVRTREKMTEIEQKLRGGKKLKGFNRLKEELEHHRRMERQYCDLRDFKA